LFELMEAIGPHRFEVLSEGPKCGAVGAVEVLAAALVHEDKSGVAETAEVLRDGSERDVGIGGDIAGWSFFVPDELEDLLSSWFGEDGEGIDHGNILVYTKI
jgi:hypothetical protein